MGSRAEPVAIARKRRPTAQRGWRLRVKRMFDVTAAAIGLVILAPVLLVVAVLVRSRLGTPVLFRQHRPGFRGVSFEVLKFRTMTDERDRDGALLFDAQRLTGFGRRLRSTSIDELPQLLNVLKGDLSLVGPRPLLVRYLDRYTPEQARRHDVLPGITGWTQVNGRNAIPWERKFELDVWYVDHWSLRLDAIILFLTMRKVLSRKGISDGVSVTSHEFLGSRAPAGFESGPDSPTPTRSSQ